MSSLVVFLIAFPFLASAILLVTTNSRLRNLIVLAACVVTGAAAIATSVQFGNGNGIFFGLPFDLPSGITIGRIVLASEVVIALFVLVVSIQYRRWIPPVLAAGQLGISIYLEAAGKLPDTAMDRLFWFDRLTMVMVLIIGIIGPLICIHALGYMRDYQRSYPMTKGRRTSFFFLLFLFLAAMFGLVISNDLPLMLVFWEVTTLCSFLLIGYTRTDETVGYAFRALNMNMLGGLGFSAAIYVLATQHPEGLDIAALVSGPASGWVLGAVALLAFAGITKSAQMPFSSWLLGAMYAPSPTSALLHSSTMVKAGVFILLRLSPAMSGSAVGDMVAFVGLLTFLFVSLTAVTETNTKKVLAYSTIGNLGLIVGCAGIGGPELVWVGVMIVIFHAVAKSLLFLVVGTLENRLYTKDMENFDTLLARMPRVSVLALTGIAGMFIAPFGIVIAKWSAIRGFLVLTNWEGAAFITIMAFGSALTIYYWGKLLMKILSTRDVDQYERSVENRISRYEWFSEAVHAVGVIAVAGSVGVISAQVVAPYAASAFPKAGPVTFLNVEPAMVVVILVAVLFLPLLAIYASRKPYDQGDFYASGRSATPSHLMGGALGATRAVSLRNYYLEGVIDGGLMFRAGTLVCGAVLAAMVVVGMVVR